MGLVSRIKESAKSKDLTIGDVEKTCNLGENSIYKWDKSSPSLDKVIRVANTIGVSIDYLATGNSTFYGTLSDVEKELLKWLDLLKEETQRDFLGQIRLYAKQHKEDWATTNNENEDALGKEELVVASK